MSLDKSKRAVKTKKKTVRTGKAKEKTLGINHRFKELEELIFEHRGQKVLLDSQVALLYGVPTKRVNEAVFRNRAKFPRGYVFQLTVKEWALLKSQDATSNMEHARSVGVKGGKRKPP